MEAQRNDFHNSVQIVALALEEIQVTSEIPVEVLREEARSQNSAVVHLEKQVAWLEDLLPASWEGRKV